MHKYLGKKALYSAVLTAMLVLGGCSSSDGESTSGTGSDVTPTSTASGAAVDGYIANGHLYADLDGSKDENTGDINTTTDAAGDFSFGETTVAHGTYLYLTGGTDLALNTPFTGALRAYFFGEATFVTPLSTLIVSLMQNEALSYAAAVTRAAAMMGLSEAQIVADPMTDPDVFVASQRVVAVATTLGGDFSVAVDALASSDMNITAAAAALVPAVDPADALAVDAFILELQTQIPADATAADLAAYQLVIADAVSNPTAIPDVNDAVAVANALGCVTFDAIKGSNTAENNITTDLLLNSCETSDDNVTFLWSSNDTALLSTLGAVVSPVYIGGDVNLSVTITSDANASVSTDKTFALTIPRLDNHSPVATADANTTAEETPISFNVLANDTDADGDALTLVAVSDDVAFNADGTVTYTPAVDFNGDFVFTYTVRDSWNGESNGTVTITVTAINDAPVLDAIAAQMVEEDFALTTLEINATDVDSGSLTYSVTAIEPAIVNASFGTGNQLELTSIANLFGDTNITVMVSDGAQNDTKTFTLTVVPVDDAPVIAAIADPSAVDEDAAPLTIGVIATDVDSVLILDANSSNTSIATAVMNGSDVIVTPVADASGTVTITVSANDSVNPLTTQTFSVTINAVDDAPVLAPLSPITVMEDNGTTTVTATATDVDNDNGAIVYSMTSSDTNIVTVSGMELTTVADANGVVEINVTATSNGKTDSQLFNFTVTPVDDAPLLAAIAPIVVNEDNGTISITPSATDIDSNDSLITYELVSLNTSVITVSGSDLVTVANANGVATVEVTARSGSLSDTTDFNVTVTAVNDAPTASDFTVPVVTGSTGITIDISTHIDDVDGDALAILTFDATTGLSQTGPTTFNYNNDGTEGLIIFNYTVEDPDGLTAGGVVTLNVSTEPVIPIANDDTATTEEEAAVNIDVLANDVNVSSISTAWVVTPANGTVQVETNNTITFTPATDKSGLFLVKYTAVSVTGHEDNGTVSVTVTGINDAPVVSFTTSTPINLTETTGERVVRVDMNITDVDTVLSSVSVDNVSSNSGTITVQSYGTDYVDVLIPAYANGDANITVTVNDGEDTTMESFSVHVTAVNSVPVITNVYADINISAGVQNHLIWIEPQDETFTLSVVSQPSNALVSIGADNTSLDIDPYVIGTEAIVIHAVNDNNASLTSDTTITIHVYDPSNQAPVAIASDFSVVADSVIQTPLDVSDSDGDPLTFTIITPPAHGNIISIDELGNLVYAAADAYIGADSFTYTANDGDLDSDPATVTIDVTASPDGDSGDSSEIPITLEQYNAYAAQSADGLAMYSVWEEGWGTESNLTAERLIVDASGPEIEISVNGTVTELIPYTVEALDETMLIDSDGNGTIDFEVKYIGTTTKEDIETDLNLTLPVGSAGFKLATLQITEEFNEWNESEYSDWNCSVPNQPCIGFDPYATLDDFVTDTTFDTNNPRMHEMWIDGYNFMFAPDTNLSDGSGILVRAGHYWDGSNDVWIVTNADVGTWEVVNVDGTDIIKVTPTVYALETVRTYQENLDGTVHTGEYYPPNSASLEYKFDETTMYHIGNSIMNRTVEMPETPLTDASSEFISFNSLPTATLPINTPMYGVWAWTEMSNYIIDTDIMHFDVNGTFVIEGTDGFSAPYTVSSNIATIYGPDTQPFADGKLVETIRGVAELSALIGIDQYPVSPVAYKFAHINYNEELSIWDGSDVYALDNSTRYTDFNAFQSAFMSGQVALDYTPSGGIGFASGSAGVGGTLAEYSPTFEVITPNAGTWEIIDVDGNTTMVFTVTVDRNNDHNAIALSDATGYVSQGRYYSADTGSYEYRYDASTKDAIVTYLTDNPINFEIETRIMRDVEAVPFTNNKMYSGQADVNSTTCERNVTTSYVWMDGSSTSGSFVMSDDPQSYTYLSSDGEIATVNDGSSDVFMAKVNEELNATQLMSETSLFLPSWAHGYRITYMNLASGEGGTEVRLDDTTIGYLESYLNNNAKLDALCTP
ncbi:MAG: tandem-95 repeat protein [Helicobacteraceae bacterium]|nr:tandem-95 repeat protein [Helicobacteraceae bacterium]